MSTHFIGNVGFSSFNNIGVVATFKNTGVVKGEEQITTIQVDVKDKVSGTIVAWGPGNDYPQKILEQAKKSGPTRRGIRFNRKAHYGNGLNLLRRMVTEQGKHDIKIVPIMEVPEIDDFWELNQMPRFWKETIADLEWWNIAFPEYILSNDYTKINRVRRQKAAWCRFELMNPDNGLVEHVYISQKFGVSSVSLDSEYVEKVPLIDSYWNADEVREYCKKNKIKKFIRPIFYPLIDEAYYPEAEWHAITKSGWLEVANSVPQYKNSMFKNQISIKFHIEIDEEYFRKTFEDEWAEFTFDQKQEQRKLLTEKINEHLSKEANAGKSLSTPMWMEDGKQVSSVKITPIDDKFKDGAYLPEAEAANSEILFALGVDPSLIGAGIPGGKLGAGSGSDKTAAFNIVMALFKTDRETTLEVFQFIKQFNGWPKDITADFENTILTTLDKNPTGSQKTTS